MPSNFIALNFEQKPYYVMRYTLKGVMTIIEWVMVSPARRMQIRESYGRWFNEPMRLKEEVLELFQGAILNLDPTQALLDWFREALDKHEPKEALENLYQVLEKNYQAFKALPPESYHQSVLEKNLSLLQTALQLSDLEKDILAVSILTSHDKEVINVLEEINDKMMPSVTHFLHFMGRIVDEDNLHEVSQALYGQSILIKTGLIEVAQNGFGSNYFDDLIQVMEPLNLFNSREFKDERELLSLWLQPIQPSHLSLEQFPHLQPKISQIQSYLLQACKQKKPGVNIFFYGQPGTGKTELSRALCAKDFEVYGIQHEVPEVEGIGPKKRSKPSRFKSYQLAQYLLSQKDNCVLVFDEAEDVFGRGFRQSKNALNNATSDQNNKSWVNQQLEENTVPTIWISNHIHQIDPAYLRRYDFLVEVPIPPRAVRLQIVQHHWKQFQLPLEILEQVASKPDIPPAILAKAAKVVADLMLPDTDTLIQTLIDQLNDWRITAGLAPIHLKNKQTLSYDSTLLNIQPSAQFFERILTNCSQAKLCFFGLPGTGKTAFAQHLAERLDKPLMVRRASDIVSAYVCETEQNIAKMFRGADREQAVLFLDEGDSFLRDRQKAHQSWEVTQTNELLTQMEGFKGIFILATNLIDQLDMAALRRFNFKVEFHPLKLDQAWSLFQKLVPNADEAYYERLQTLQSRTALNHGHFANVSEQLTLAQIQYDGEMVLQLLREEAKWLH